MKQKRTGRAFWWVGMKGTAGGVICFASEFARVLYFKFALADVRFANSHCTESFGLS